MTVRFRPVREKKSIKDQRGWLVLNAARRQLIVAPRPMVQELPLSGSPVRPSDIAQERESLPGIIGPQRQLRRHEPELRRVQPDRATPRKLRRRSSTATAITHSQNIR